MGQMTGASQVQQLFDMITVNSAKCMHLDDYGIEIGNTADLVIFDGRNEEEIIRLQSESTHVIRRGNVICETAPASRQLKYKDETVDFKL